MDIYPGARRALLTAYADTGAAIDAINVVDLDHYLLKPWDPPEEKLYPVVDTLLEAWQVVGLPAGAGDEDRRSSLVRAVVAGAGVPGPQPGPLPLVRGGRAGGATAARGGGGRRPDAAAGDHPGRRSAGGAVRLRAGQPGGARDHSVGGLLRPDRDRRRAGRPGIGRVRRLRGTADRPGRAVRRPAARPARAPGSRIISGSRTGSRGRSSPTVRAGRRAGSAPSC